MNMKRTCKGCLAYSDSDICYLGYKTKTVEYFNQALTNKPVRKIKQVPKEECPKPLTNTKLIEEFKKNKSK